MSEKDPFTTDQANPTEAWGLPPEKLDFDPWSDPSESSPAVPVAATPKEKEKFSIVKKARESAARMGVSEIFGSKDQQPQQSPAEVDLWAPAPDSDEARLAQLKTESFNLAMAQGQFGQVKGQLRGAKAREASLRQVALDQGIRNLDRKMSYGLGAPELGSHEDIIEGLSDRAAELSHTKGSKAKEELAAINRQIAKTREAKQSSERARDSEGLATAEARLTAIDTELADINRHLNDADFIDGLYAQDIRRAREGNASFNEHMLQEEIKQQKERRLKNNISRKEQLDRERLGLIQSIATYKSALDSKS